MKNLLLDTEVNSLKNPQPIEVAWISLDDNLSREEQSAFFSRYRPTNPIEFGAMATHHILEEDLLDKLLHTEFKFPEQTEYLIGHNIDFDWEVCGKPPVKRICTLALARFCWPHIDSHTLGALMYFLKGASAREDVLGAHSAANDVLMNLFVLNKITAHLNIKTVEEAWAQSEVARIPVVMSFGKYKGQKIVDIPRDYKQWALRQPDFDEYVLKAFRNTL